MEKMPHIASSTMRCDVTVTIFTARPRPLPPCTVDSLSCRQNQLLRGTQWHNWSITVRYPGTTHLLHG